MNKNDKVWLKSKINHLTSISSCIKLSLELKELGITSFMAIWLDNFVKQINTRTE